MPIIRIATIRTKGYSDYALHLLRNHDWFLSESDGTMSFKPNTLMSETATKRVLKDYIEGKGGGVNRLSVPN